MWGKERVREPEVVCSLVTSPVVYLETVARQKISYLMAEYTHQEWLAYLVGRRSENSNIFVEDISVPPHATANGASAEAEPLHIPKNCVGVIHSHHRMGAFHSATDQAYVDKNFPVSITVANGQEKNLTYDAVSYQQTPCGKSLTLKCVVKYVQPMPLFNKGEFLAKAKKNIDKPKKVKAHVSHYLGQQSGADGGMVPIGGGHYVPIRYRDLFDIAVENKGVMVDQRGVVLGQAEVDDVLARGGLENG